MVGQKIADTGASVLDPGEETGHIRGPVESFLFGSDSRPQLTSRQRRRRLSDDQLFRAIGVAGYTPEGGTASLFSGAYEKLLNEASRRGLKGASPFETLTDVTSGIGAFATATGRNKSKLRQSIAETIQTAQAELEIQRRNANIKLAEDALSEFESSGAFDTLLERIRTLPDTLDDDTVARIKRQAVDQIKLQETGRLRRVGAAVGLRGAGSGAGSIAALANQSAAFADSQITAAFNDIAIRKAELSRQDELQSISMENQLLQGKQTQQLQLLQNLQSATAGQPADLTGGMQNFSAFLEALNANAAAESAARANNKSSLYAGVGLGVASIVAAPFTGGASLALLPSAASMAASSQ